MDNQFLEIKNYIDEISLYDTQEDYKYNHFPFIQDILNTFTPKQHDDFIKEVFNWSNFQLYIIADFLHSTDFILQGKYDSGYVFCMCFSKIDDVKYLEYLYFDLELNLMQRKFFDSDLILPNNDIINNLYLLINHLRDEQDIDFCLKIIENLND